MHLAHILLHINLLCLKHCNLYPRLTEILDQRFIFRQPFERTVEKKCSFLLFFLIFRSHLLFGINEKLLTKLLLSINDYFDISNVFFKELIVSSRSWSRYNQWRTSIVYEYRVYFIDNGIVVLPLYKILRRSGHIISQVVKAKFIVGTESDVCIVCLSSPFTIWFMLIYAVYRKPMEKIKRTHPFAISLGEVVVYCNDMNATTSKCIKKNG